MSVKMAKKEENVLILNWNIKFYKNKFDNHVDHTIGNHSIQKNHVKHLISCSKTIFTTVFKGNLSDLNLVLWFVVEWVYQT